MRREKTGSRRAEIVHNRSRRAEIVHNRSRRAEIVSCRDSSAGTGGYGKRNCGKQKPSENGTAENGSCRRNPVQPCASLYSLVRPCTDEGNMHKLNSNYKQQLQAAIVL